VRAGQKGETLYLVSNGPWLLRHSPEPASSTVRSSGAEVKASHHLRSAAVGHNRFQGESGTPQVAESQPAVELSIVQSHGKIVRKGVFQLSLAQAAESVESFCGFAVGKHRSDQFALEPRCPCRLREHFAELAAIRELFLSAVKVVLLEEDAS
jgi:hypothetical protein